MEREQPAASLGARHWYLLLWLGLLLVWLPLTQLLLPQLAMRLLASSSLLLGMVGFAVVALQGLALVAAASVASAATTSKLLHRPPREVTVRSVWALFGSLWVFLAAVLTVPAGVMLALAGPVTVQDAATWILLALVLAWAALLAAGTGELGPRRALSAAGACLRHAFGFASLLGILVIALFAGSLAALAYPLGIHSPAYLLTGSVAATVCAALTALVWEGARRRATPERGAVQPLPGSTGLREAQRLLGFLRGGGERI